MFTANAASLWRRVKDAVFDPTMPTSAMYNPNSNVASDSIQEVVSQRMEPRTGRCYAALACCCQTRSSEWRFGAAIDPECLWNRVWHILMFVAIALQIYALLYSAAFVQTHDWPRTLDLELFAVDVLYAAALDRCVRT